jgi:hypothetical protein
MWLKMPAKIVDAPSIMSASALCLTPPRCAGTQFDIVLVKAFLKTAHQLFKNMKKKVLSNELSNT